MHTTDVSYVPSLQTVEIKVSLEEYPSVETTTSFEVEITIPCDQVTIEAPATPFMTPLEVMTFPVSPPAVGNWVIDENLV